LNFAGVDAIVETAKPDDTEMYHYEEAIEQVSGVWTAVWKQISNFTEEQLAARVVAATQAKWNELRATRNAKLVAADHVVTRHRELLELGNEPYSVDGVFCPTLLTQVLVYKNQLRDFPDTVTDIDNVTWPIDPYYQNWESSKQGYLNK
jgi:hypothetical protein